MKLKAEWAAFVIFFVGTSAYAQGFPVPDPDQQISRANCLNNESITFQPTVPPMPLSVFSWHFEHGIRRHYVTENAPTPDCAPNPPCHLGYCNTSGQYCLYYLRVGTRQAAIHGSIAPSEAYSDGPLVPGVTTKWSVEGVHGMLWLGAFPINFYTSANDCNL
jgi:hypothetical protein